MKKLNLSELKVKLKNGELKIQKCQKCRKNQDFFLSFLFLSFRF